MNTGPSISVAGGMSWSVQYNLDGAPHVDTYVGTSMPLPFPDALQEFRLSTGAQEASSGGHSGAVVDAVTKSGANAFHGDLFEFFRNSDLNARDFFAAGSDGLKRNQFGGVVGGRIIKDKLFFFLGYQGTTIRQNLVNQSAYVPTAAELKGDFSQYIAAGCPSAAAVASFTGRAESFHRTVRDESCGPENSIVPAADYRPLRARAYRNSGTSEPAPGAAENRLPAKPQTQPVCALHDHADRDRGPV